MVEVSLIEDLELIEDRKQYKVQSRMDEQQESRKDGEDLIEDLECIE